MNVTVNQTLASIAITPAMPTLTSLAQQQFAAAGYDQFGATMGLTGTTWSATAGSIDNNGLFTAPDASGAVTVTATNGSLANTTVVTVVNTAPTVATPASATPSQVAGNATALSVLGADDGGEANLTYTWTITSSPAGPQSQHSATMATMRPRTSRPRSTRRAAIRSRSRSATTAACRRPAV